MRISDWRSDVCSSDLANDNPPKLRRFDQKGFLLDLIEFHPAYHEVMRRSCRAGLHCSVWEHMQAPEEPPPEGAQVARPARLYMTQQHEPGNPSPLTTHTKASCREKGV